MVDCCYFEHCTAPLCPLDKASLKRATWFPDEPICRRRDIPGWVKKQKELRKRPPKNSGGLSVAAILNMKQRHNSGKADKKRIQLTGF